MTIENRKCRLAAIICASVLGLAPVAGFSQDGFDGIFIFGDSLSDPGNAYALTGETSKAPYDPIPSAAYAMGGHHFSNGKTWAERLARNLNANNGGKPAFEDPGRYGNYAFGGARARDAGTSPTSSTQVALFLGDHGSAPPDALYVLQFGGNDIRDALFDPLNAGAIVIAAVAAEIGNIQQLYTAGARNFAVAYAPNIGRAPAVVAAGPVAVSAAEGLAQFHNDVLEYGYAPLGLPGLNQLESSLPDVTIHRIDFFGFINDVTDDPAAFGISDPFFPCLMFGVKSEAKCDNPDERAFWDGIHPTAVIHAALGDYATEVVSGN